MQNETVIKSGGLINAVQKKWGEKARFCTVTCLNLGDQLELLYHFEPWEAVEPVTTLRVRVDRGEAVPSISGIYGCAVLAENEMAGDYAVNMTGMSLDFGGKLMLTGESKEFVLPRTLPEQESRPETEQVLAKSR